MDRSRRGMEVRSIAGMGGWTFDIHHALGLATQTLALGDGRRLQRDSLPSVMKQMTLDSLPPGPFVVAPDGSILTGTGSRIYQVVDKQAPVPFAGNGMTTAYAGENLPATDPGIGLDASDFAISRDGSVFIADRTNHIVRRVDLEGVISTYAGVPTERQLTAVDGPALSTRLDAPRFVAVAPDGSVFVSTRYNIMQITPDQRLVRFAGRQETNPTVNAASPPPDGEAATTVLIEPRGLAVAPDGTLYAILTGIQGGVGNGGGSVIVKFVDGLMSIVAGSGCTHSCGPVWIDGDAARAVHLQPTSITVDHGGNVVFSDEANTTNSSFDLIATIDRGGQLFTLAGLRSNSGPLIGDGSPATNSRISIPSLTDRSVATGPKGLYVKTNVLSAQGTTGGAAILRRTRTVPDNLGITSVVPAQGEDALYTFDARGRHLSTVHSLTITPLKQFGYDSGGRLITITDESGNVTSIERDAQGNPLAIVGPFGQRTEVALDANGYLEQVTDPLGRTYGMTYSNGLLTSFTNPRGLTSTMGYDDSGRLELDTDASSGTHTLARSESTNTWSVTDTTGLGRTTSYETIDGEEVQTKTITHPDGTESTVTSGANGVVTTSHPDGTLTTTSAVPEGRFGLNGAVTSSTTVLPSGLTSVRMARRLYLGTDPEDLLAFTEYTDENSINGRTWRTRYTRNDRTFVQTSPRGRDVTRITDLLGRTVQTQTEGLNAVVFTYDAQGRLATTQQGTRLSTNTYVPSGASAGYLASATDPLSIATTFTRDALGRPLTETRAATTTAFTWDATGNLESVTPPGKPVHSLAYTPVNLLESYEPPAAGLTQPNTIYDYDLDRMLRTETRPTGQQIVRTPDSAGRLDTVAIPGGLIDYEYYPPATPSGAGKVSDIFGPYGVDLSLTYDGFLTTSTEWSGDITGAVAWQYNTDFQKLLESVSGATGTSTTAFGYDNDQLLTCASPTTCNPAGSDALTLSRSLQHGLVTGITLGSTSETIAYNTFGEFASQNARYSGTSFANLTYHVEGSATAARDALGRIRQKTEIIGGVTKVYAYVYDDLGRLSDVTIDGVLNEHFGYDPNGNRTTHYSAATGLTVTPTYDDQDRLITYGDWVFTYTANGELETKTNTSTSDEWIFSYDILGNLLSVGLPDGTLIEYLVDALGRRVGKKINGVLTKQWLYRDALKPVAELDGSGALIAQFVYGSKGNVPDYVRRGGTTYRVVSDHLGSPRYVVNVANASDVPFIASYSAFGSVTSAGLDWMPFGFAGGIYDADTGLVRFGARDYDPMVGRWTSKDPIGFDSNRTNIYVYAANDPVNRSDQSGLFDFGDACTIAATCQEECARLNAWDPLGYAACMAGCVVGGIVWEERQPYQGTHPDDDPDDDLLVNCQDHATRAQEECLRQGRSVSACLNVYLIALRECLKRGKGY